MSPTAQTPTLEPPPAQRARRARLIWGAVVVVMLVAGAALTVVVAGNTEEAAREEERRAFDEAAAEVVHALRLEIQHQDDLVITAAAYAARQPHMTGPDLAEWLEAVDAIERYPDLDSVGLIRVVPHAELGDYLVGLATDAASSFGPVPDGVDPAGLIAPPGPRERYCFLRAIGYLGGAAVELPPHLDLCTDPAIAGIVDEPGPSGAATYEAGISVEGRTPMLVFSPSVLGDRVVGGIAAEVDMESLLTNAVGDRSQLSAVLRHDGTDTQTAVVADRPSGEYAAELEVLPDWSLAIEGSVLDAEGLDTATLLTLAVGIIAAATSAVLVYNLGTGRARAMELVDEATTELRHQALHDSLTGLPNRLLIADRAEALLARARRDDTLPAAMFIDLDGFKDVNDSLGHDAGDDLLRAVSERLSRALRGVDTIGRLGGDEFVVLLDGASVPASAEFVAQRLLDAMSEPFFVGDDPVAVRVSASVGIAIGDRPTATDLLRDADVALYEAKAAGRDCWRTYDSDQDSSVRRRNEIEFELRKLVPDEALRLVYQPIYDLDGLTIVDVEALLRWDHSTRGQISPAEFIPLLERSGRISEIGAWVLEHACTQLAEWRADGIDIGVAVNVSARQLDDSDFVDRLDDIVRRAGIPAEALTVEVTETALMGDPVRAADVLRDIKALGIRIAIDDFGTGYSSLAYLQRFPVDTLKIDRMFVNALDGTPESTALVHTLVQLGQQLGLRTLAEGVETDEQLAHLRAHFIDHVQGFLLARPLSADAVRDEAGRERTTV